jgi:hypothetical protein
MLLNERMRYETAVNAINMPQRPATGPYDSHYPTYRNNRLGGGMAPPHTPSASLALTHKPPSYNTQAALANSFDAAFARLRQHRDDEQKIASDAAFEAEVQRAQDLRRSVEASGVTRLAGGSPLNRHQHQQQRRPTPPPLSSSIYSSVPLSSSSLVPPPPLPPPSSSSIADHLSAQPHRPFHLIEEWEQRCRDLERRLAESEALQQHTVSGLQARAAGLAEREVIAKDEALAALRRELQVRGLCVCVGGVGGIR